VGAGEITPEGVRREACAVTISAAGRDRNAGAPYGNGGAELDGNQPTGAVQAGDIPDGRGGTSVTDGPKNSAWSA
jgi:hypothetical protein